MFCFSHFAVIRTKGEVRVTWEICYSLGRRSRRGINAAKIYDLLALLIVLQISD